MARTFDQQVNGILKEIILERRIPSPFKENVNPPVDIGRNILYFGIPGSGKSYLVKNLYCNDPDKYERVVFYPDYAYTDFIGQLYPVVINDVLQYTFKAGPFTRILYRALNNPNDHYFLIIEEINRGNAPAIFGDVLQLLDRDYEGNSEYSITNEDMAAIVFSDKEQKVFIPSNLSIIGTMNTSDQNIFTLDTAFQRRWEMRLIRNDFSKVNFSLANKKILDTDLTWIKFVSIINKIILNRDYTIAYAEDKRIGVYFVSESELDYHSENANTNTDDGASSVIDEVLQHNRFAEKVIKYLWDDAFKLNREIIFKVDIYECLEDLIEAFSNTQGNDRFRIFTSLVYDQLFENTN